MESNLSAEGIAANLNTQVIGRRVIYTDRLSSTMDEAQKQVKLGALEGTAVIAGEQTAGRGRMKRSWLSPGGGIALSIVIYPAPDQLPSLIMLASLAVVRSVGLVTGLKAGIKWPNDVLINSRKFCGILIESQIKGHTVDYAVIGIGLNVNFNPGDYPGIPDTATSLALEMGQPVSRLALVRHLLTQADRLYTAIQGGDSIFEEWRDNLVTLGQRVRVNCGENIYEGIAESVAPDSSLWLRQSDGILIKVVAGDVTLSQ